MSNSNKTACSTGGRAGGLRPANSKLSSVSGKWEGRVPQPAPGSQRRDDRPNLRGRLTVQAWHLVRSAAAAQYDSFGGPIPYHYCRILWGPPKGLIGAPEERWASWQGQTAKSQDFQVPRCCQPSQDRGDGTEELDSSFFLHVFFNPWVPSCHFNQTHTVRLLGAGSEGHDLSSTVTNDPIAPSPSLRPLCLPNHEEPVAGSAPLADRFGAGPIAGRRPRLKLSIHRVRLRPRVRNSELGRPGRQRHHQCKSTRIAIAED